MRTTLRLCLAALALFSAWVCTIHAQTQTPHTPVCGTAVFMWAQAHPGKDENPAMKLLARQMPSGRPVLFQEKNVLSKNAHFRIHYTTTGADSVSVIDKDANNVPDYIDSVAFYMEMAWDVEVNQYKFTPPPPDNQTPGMGDIGPEIDVYIQALSADLYGGAIPEDNVVGSGRVSGYLWLDNDYKGYPTPGIAGLRVTTAHEFHHIIQFSAYYYDYSQATIYEATSVWFEQQVHPGIPDYIQYVNYLLLHPQYYGMATHNVRDGVTGYGHELYMDYIVKASGDRDIVRRWWNHFRDSKASMDALEDALHEYGMALSPGWCQFAQWCYYTGKRALRQTDTLPDGSPALLKDAGKLTMLKDTMTHNLDNGDVLFSGDLYPLSFGLYRVTMANGNVNIRDTVDFLVSNARDKLGEGGVFRFGRENFSLEVSGADHPGYLKLSRQNKPTVYYRLNTASTQFCLNPISDGSPVVQISTTTFPQPYINDGVSRLLVAIPLPNGPVRTLHLRVYSVSNTLVADVSATELQSDGNWLGLSWNGRNQAGAIVPSGTYTYTLSVNDAPPQVGKIAVITGR